MRFSTLLGAVILAIVVMETHSDLFPIPYDPSANLLAKMFLRKTIDAISTKRLAEKDLIFSELSFVIQMCNKTKNIRREDAIKWVEKNPDLKNAVKIEEAGILEIMKILVVRVSITVPGRRDPMYFELYVDIPEHTYPNELISIGPLNGGNEYNC
ncbi:hypothetical protein CAEBREN_12133 [Caenorhabditis brenneri]|uniref:Uncharacterized protein n=1 Tax=Caenorhabditis brenneri TaxID=135651 RepID=G0MX17_CAEBE|nr:hypothetical protein CAEBREN_12133 [Caenorhabditis brenneri]